MSDTPILLPAIAKTDTLFRDDLPEPGDLSCTCSRCGKVIEDNCIRVGFGREDAGDAMHTVTEYRYHPACVNMESWFVESNRPE